MMLQFHVVDGSPSIVEAKTFMEFFVIIPQRRAKYLSIELILEVFEMKLIGLGREINSTAVQISFNLFTSLDKRHRSLRYIL